MLENTIMQNPESVMFPGKETANIGYPTQWALNPSAYQNMDASQVDWASLAQQWIAMKEAAAIVSAESAPPAPKLEEEAGEAPMEVENNETDPPHNWNSSESWGNNDWNQWGWGWTGAAELDSKVPMDPEMAMQSMMDGFPVTNDTTPALGYATATGSSTSGPTFQHGYWTAPQVEQSSRPSNTDRKKREPKSSRGTRTHREKVHIPAPPIISPLMTASLPGQALDAAKRRQLPAWIREGLEKMEREKQRAIEREQERVAREEAEKETKRREEEELARLKAEASGLTLIPPKSKFESDSEPEAEEKDESAEPIRNKLSSPDVEREPPPQPLVQKSNEEIMQEVMLAVRRSLTEILLEVTDQEIHTVSQEELARYDAAQATRLNAMKASKSKALAAITSGLGLGAYESSSEESEEEASNNELSDQQLQEIIKRKRMAFEATSREIEAEVRRAERREAGEDSDESPGRDRDKITVVNKRESSGTPPPTPPSETPEKINDRRISRDKKPTKLELNKTVDSKKTEQKAEHVSDSKSKKKHDSTPIKHNNRETSSSSSDSEEDSSSSSESSDSEEDRRYPKSSKSKKRRHRSSSSDSKRSKRHKKDKSHKYEEKEKPYKYEEKDKSYKYEDKDKSHRYEDKDKSHRYEEKDKSRRYEEKEKSHRYEEKDKLHRYEEKDKSHRYEEKDNHKSKYDDKEKSRSKKRDRDEYEKSHKSRDERSRRDKYRDESDDDKYSRKRRSRSGSSRGRRRSRDRSHDRRTDKYDRYERSRHRRSTTPSRHRR